MSNPLCIYHANCADGFGAAWAVNCYFRRGKIPVDLLAASYGDAPPDVTDREVIIVDFSYPRDVLAKMCDEASSVKLIDHHKTAIEDLVGLEHPKLTMVLDAMHSGAVLTWMHYFHIQTCPQLLLYVQDRDLWKFKLNNTRAVMSAVSSYAYSIDVWDRLAAMSTSELVAEGIAIERKYQKDLMSLLKTKMMGRIAGFMVPVANVPAMFASDIGHMLISDTDEDVRFSATYYDTPEGRKFSLRSGDDLEDVSAIAKLFGGGGHRNAAGFFIKHDDTFPNEKKKLLDGSFLCFPIEG